MEKDYFYYRNPHGEIEKHHVSEFGKLSTTRSWETKTPAEDIRHGMEVAAGEEKAQTHDPQPLQGVEEEVAQDKALTDGV